MATDQVTLAQAVMDLPGGLATDVGNATRADDGSALSVLFNDFKADSNPTDNTQTAEAALVNFEIPINSRDSKFVLVQARGYCISTGLHSWARAMIWVNGKRMPMSMPQSGSVDDANFHAALCVKVTQKSVLRVSVTLLAQRDLFEANSSAQCGLDSLEFLVSP